MMDTRPTIEITGRYWRGFPPKDPPGAAEENLALLVDETTFLIIDVYGKYYDDGVNLPEAEERWSGPGWRDIVRNRIVPAKAAAVHAGLRVVYLTNYLSPGLSARHEFPKVTLQHYGLDMLEEWQPPTPVLEHASIIAPAPDEPLIHKQFYSGFFETTLDTVLRGYGTRNIVAVGFDSRICLANTLTDALYRDYRVIAIRDAIGTTEYPETAGGEWASFLAVRYIESDVGYTVTTDDFVAACNAVTKIV